jgi:Tol biopolymer transport system component
MTRNVELDRRLGAWLEEEAAPHAPGELHARFIDAMAGSRQRPGWATTERWISMETRAQLGAVPRGAIVLATLGILAALAAGAIAVGSSGEPKAPPPFGPAANGLIAFADGGDIHVVEPDGSGRRALTSGPELDDAPTWSRDGRRLAYLSEPAEGGPPFELRVIDADGGEPLTIAQQSAGSGPGYFFTWSADGSEIAYSFIVPELGQDPCPTHDSLGGMCGMRIFVAAVDGSGSRQIGDPDLDARSPELSPDGRTIAFGGGTAGSADLYAMGWDGSDARRLTTDAVPDGGWAFIHSAWSSDGRRIVTQSDSDIWLVEADGSGEANISDHYSDENIGRYAPGDDMISWRRGGTGVTILPSDAPEPVTLTAEVERAVWSPDGTLLVGNDALAQTLRVVDRQGAVLAEIETPGLGFYPSWQRLAQ